MHPTDPASSRVPSPPAPSRLSREAADLARHAARYAVIAYPGPIGDLISRELHRYLEAGEELGAPAMAPRLIAALRQDEARHPLPPAPGWGHLPPRYIPGSPLHWTYRTAADE